MKQKRALKKAGIILFWLLVWQAAQLAVANEVLLTGPVQVAQFLLSQAGEAEFWKVIGCSIMRIGLGFLLAFLAGIVLGALSHRFFMLKELLAPLISIFKTIPVVSFVVLILIWYGSEKLSLLCSFLVAFPNVYESILTGLSQINKERKELMEVFFVPVSKKIVYLYMPAVFPYLTNSLKTCFGMSMKSGVAAEVIGTPEYSIGERIYLSKVYLDTPGIFGWTIVLITAAFLLEKGLLWGLSKLEKRKPFLNATKSVYAKRKRKQNNVITEICLNGISKNYAGNWAVKDFELVCEKAATYCIQGESGAGKTTLLKILAGLEPADAGTITLQTTGHTQTYFLADRHRGCGTYRPGAAMVFQDIRLVEEISAVDNVMLTCACEIFSREMAEKELLALLPAECLHKPVSELSGGMRRRVELVRVMNADSRFILLDEPFAGLDRQNKEKAAAYILNKRGERLLFVSVHSEQECSLLQGTCVKLQPA